MGEEYTRWEAIIMSRLNIVVEGQTEETFVRDVLAPHLKQNNITVRARMVETGRRGKKIFRGGLVSYEKLKQDLQNWMEVDSEAWFTTMIDLYGLPRGFPGLQKFLNNENEPVRLKGLSPYEIAESIEASLAKNINHPRFIPYIQLHEFEALILSDPLKFENYFFKRSSAIQKLYNMAINFASPEHINNSPETAPSKRIIELIPEYRYNKKTAGPIIAAEIGLPKIRRACKHFDHWLKKLESLQ